MSNFLRLHSEFCQRFACPRVEYVESVVFVEYVATFPVQSETLNVLSSQTWQTLGQMVLQTQLISESEILYVNIWFNIRHIEMCNFLRLHSESW